MKIALLLMVTISVMAAAMSGLAAAAEAIDAGTETTPPVAAQPDARPGMRINLDAFSSNSGTSALGLKAKPQRAREGVSMPFGLSYIIETKSLFFPFDERNELGLSFSLDVNKRRAVELVPSASALGLQPKRAPGLTLQKKF